MRKGNKAADSGPAIDLKDFRDLPDEAVISHKQAARLLNISDDTLTRLYRAGTGPAAVRLSPRRMGHTMRSIRQWLAARTAAPSDAA
jgi:predicted DNA-binding transcriptional regulator AlpA